MTGSSDDEMPTTPIADGSGSASSTLEIEKVLQELRVHQIEIELQNEELRQAQVELDESRQRYFDLYDRAPVGYLTLSKEGVIEEANHTAARLLGVTRSQLVKQSFTRFIQPFDQDTYYLHNNRTLSTGLQQSCDLRLVTSDERLCWARIESTMTTDPRGTILLRATLSDITASKQAESTLKASEARHRILFEKSHDALMTLSPPDWRFTSGNAKTLAIFGAPDEASFLAHPSSEYWPEQQPDGSKSAALATMMIEKALCEGSHFYEWTYRRLSGEEFPATVLLTRIEIDGEPLLQATVRDETEMKTLRARLSQQDRLSSMGMLAAGVAHEINNPLAYVLYNIETAAEELPALGVAVKRCVSALRDALGAEGFTEALGPDASVLDPSNIESLTERIQEALGGTLRISTIARAISTFSRVESSQRGETNVNYAIESAATLALNDIKFQAKLVVALGNLPTIWASEGKLSQVFLNLLLNAAQSIDKEHAKSACIHVRSWAENNKVFVQVADTGRGIPPANLERIFDPFFTTKAIGVGSGLGLSICRNIVTEFGGDIQVDSEPGKGTRFLVSLPISQADFVAESAESVSVPAPVAVRRSRVLVVDDEPSIRKAIVRMLQAAYEVLTASSGIEAQLILRQDQAFDVILCDLMMPDMTGIELHQWLVADVSHLADQVVFITGGAFTPNALRYLNDVSNRRLEKPFEPQRLRQVIADVVTANRAKPASHHADPMAVARKSKRNAS